ncbi:MAG TPA: oxidoreductase [Dehalococcoidia bacterium]|nr:oxidoreductase [Dehalococcoidia bacterium]
MTDTISRAVLITGCSTGIGRVTAARLASRGHTVYATARRLSDISDLADAGCRTLQLDVCDEASMHAAVAAVQQAEGAVGVLVNNAGYGQDGPIEEVPIDVVRRQFETNVFGLVRMTQLVLPGMRRQRWGRIVNVSSMGGKLVFPGGGFYHATKFAVEAISDALRFEVRGFGIDVSVIEPGAIRTRFGETSVESMAAAAAEASPYAAFNAGVEQRVQATYRGMLATGPDIVAKAIERAITAKRPRTRYPLTPGARTMLFLRRALPDRAWDALMRTQFPSPRA